MFETAGTKFKIAYLLSVKSGESALLLAISSLLMAMGNFFVDNASNYDSMYDIASPIAWGFLFLIYSCVKFYSAFNRTPSFIRTSFSVIGLWAWNYVFLSFVVFDTVAPAAAEFLIIIPIIAEVWSMLALPQPRHWREDRRKKL